MKCLYTIVFQHNAIFITIFRYKNTLLLSNNTTLPSFYRFHCVSVDRHIALNQLAASMTLKTMTFIFALYSSI